MQQATSINSDLAQELISRARGLIPALRQRAAQAEAESKVPDETISDFQDAGFFKILQPKKYGGYEMDPQVFYAVQMAVAEGCMSSAWVLGVVAVHNWQLALFDPQAQEDVWKDDPTTLISSSYMPRAKVTPADGGYRISGRWGFSSGVDHCQWAFLGGLVPNPEGGPPDYRTFLVRRGDFTIDHNWDTLGLRGTGSHDVLVEDAFVPAYRTHRSKDGFAATSPGLKVNDAPLFKLPFGQIFVRAVSSSSIGALQGALDEFRTFAGKRVSNNDFSKSTDDPDTQLLVAQVTAEIDEMKLVLNRNFDRLMHDVGTDTELDLEERLNFRYQSAAISDRCSKLITRMFYACGAGGLYRSNALGRTFVDIHSGRTHVANNLFKVGRNVGNFLLGGENTDTFV